MDGGRLLEGLPERLREAEASRPRADRRPTGHGDSGIAGVHYRLAVWGDCGLEGCPFARVPGKQLLGHTATVSLCAAGGGKRSSLLCSARTAPLLSPPPTRATR